MTPTAQIIAVSPLAKEYAPYDTLPAFENGIADYLASSHSANPYDSYKAQAYDRGRECASRWLRGAEAEADRRVGAQPP